MEYYSIYENKIKIGTQKEELHAKQFVIGDENHKDTQQLFLYVLKYFIEKYNTLSEEKLKKEGIFYMKQEKVILGNITEELFQTYKTYKELFNGLMAGNSGLFREYNPKLDDNKNKAWSENNDKKWESRNFLENSTKDYISQTNGCLTTISEKPSKPIIDRNKKLKYDLDHFSCYYNGMYFEHIALETFFKLIDEKYDKLDNNLISLLPRIIFYKKKKPGNKYDDDSCGFSEIDCAFVLKEKDKIQFEPEKITCFDNYNIEDEYQFFNVNNVTNLEIEKDNVVILEVKSHWEELIIKGKNNRIINRLIQFIKKAMNFVNLYRKLKLIEENQKIVLIYLYDNSMYYNFSSEKKNIIDAYKEANKINNLKLYIAYFQPYLKIMNSFDRVKKLRELNEIVLNQQVEVEKQKMIIKQQKVEREEEKQRLEQEQEKLRTKNEQLEEKIRNLENELENMKKLNYLRTDSENELKHAEDKKYIDISEFHRMIEEIKNNFDERLKILEQSKENNKNGKKYSITSISNTISSLKDKGSDN